MDTPFRRNLAAGVVFPLLMLLAWLLAAQPVLAAPRSAAASVPPLPLVFEENRGQADPRVKFLARGAGYVLFITVAAAGLADRRNGQAVRVHLRGARPDVEVAGLEPLYLGAGGPREPPADAGRGASNSDNGRLCRLCACLSQDHGGGRCDDSYERA